MSHHKIEVDLFILKYVINLCFVKGVIAMDKELGNPTEKLPEEQNEKLNDNETEESSVKFIEELIKEPAVELNIEDSVELNIEESGELNLDEPSDEAAEKHADKSEEESIEEPVGEAVEEGATAPLNEQVVELAGEPSQRERSIFKRIMYVLIKHKILVISIITLIAALVAAYILMAQYFRNHLYIGAEVNGIDLSGKTADDAIVKLIEELDAYTLDIKGLYGRTEQIKSEDVGLKYDSDLKFQRFNDPDNRDEWISASVTTVDSQTVGITYDESLLKQRIDQLSFLDSNITIEPKEPGFQYVNNSYVIVDAVEGNKVNRELLYSSIVDAIRNGITEIDLEAKGCYIKPQYNSSSSKVIQARDTLNKYVSVNITYTFGDKKEILDGSKVNQWLIVDDNYAVNIDDGKLNGYIDQLFNTYNSNGNTRNFTTTSGEAIQVSGGDYGGWSMNKSAEAQYLISAIKESKTLTKEPMYSNSIGSTYVEIDLARQHMWFYKNGTLIIEGDVVTGDVKRHRITPPGVYKLKAKAKNAILRGPGYAAHVTYWMPFNGGIGIHDAVWRKAFGGNIYVNDGSHGCVNSPYNVAQAIFNEITPGDPVVCY
jgi:hypothetical protein